MYGSVVDRGEEREVVVKLDRFLRFEKNETVRLTADPDALHVFDTVRGDRLS